MPSYPRAVPAPATPPFVSVGLPAPMALALAGMRTVRPLGLGDLHSARLAAEGADVIACPLMSGAVDAICVIEALKAAGFTGMLLVVAPALPNPAMVERELHAVVTGFSLRLLTM